MTAWRLRALGKELRFLRYSYAALLLIGMIGCAAAALGPAYNFAARESTARDVFAAGSPIESGFQLVQQGSLLGALDTMDSQQASIIAAHARLPGDGERLFSPPLQAERMSIYLPPDGQKMSLVWRTDVCAHLTLTAGRCPAAPNEILASAPLMTSKKWAIGVVVPAGKGHDITIVGSYDVPDTTLPYWSLVASSYFTDASPRRDEPIRDAFFTTRETLEGWGNDAGGTLTYERRVRTDAVTPADVDPIAAIAKALTVSGDFDTAGVFVNTDMEATAAHVHASWTTLSLPVLLITLQTILLVWLLLYTTVGGALESRAAYVSLAHLRGFRGLRLLSVAIGGMCLVLALCWPLGVAVSVAAGHVLAHAVLRPGTAMHWGALSWLAAAAGALGGVVAAVVGGWRLLRMRQVDGSLTAGDQSKRRPWVADLVVLAVLAAGLVELVGPGSPRHAISSPLTLAIPTLVALGIAILAARLLQLAGRAAFGVTSKHGSLAGFLAVRHISRQPGGARSTVILTAAVAMFTYGVASLLVGETDRAQAAALLNSAPVVITVPSTSDRDKQQAVADTGGSIVVRSVFDAGRNSALMAVPTDRVASIGNRPPGVSSVTWARMLRDITPPMPAPVELDGDTVQVRIDVAVLSSPLSISGEIASGATRQHIFLGTISRAGHFSGPPTRIANCPCELRSIALSAPGTDAAAPVTVKAALVGIAVAASGAAGQELPAGALAPDNWTQSVGGGDPHPVASFDGRLTWPEAFKGAQLAALSPRTVPTPLPAIVAAAPPSATASAPASDSDTTTTTSAPVKVGDRFEAAGLDGRPMSLIAVDVVDALPGAPTGGELVDARFAEQSAAGATVNADEQVWTTAAGEAATIAALKAGAVPVVDVMREADRRTLLRREGPGIATVLYVADSLAATALAVAGGLAAAAAVARRRRYEYASLIAYGETRGKLLTGAYLEQSAVLLFGGVAGVAGGLVAAALTLPRVPQLLKPIPGSHFASWPPIGPLAAILGGALALLLIASAISSYASVATTKMDVLRGADQ